MHNHPHLERLVSRSIAVLLMIEGKCSCWRAKPAHFVGHLPPAKQINQGLIRFSSLWRKARDDVAEVGTVERRVFVDLAREEALPKRAKWNEADSEFLEGRQHFRFRVSPPQRVFTLDCSDRLDSVCMTNRLHS